MARTPRRSTASAGATGEGTARRVRDNLPRPTSAPVARTAPTSTPPPAVKRGPLSRFGRRLLPRQVADIVSELKKVTWPTFAETRYLTIVVAIVATAVGLFLGVIDLAFGQIIEKLFF